MIKNDATALYSNKLELVQQSQKLIDYLHRHIQIYIKNIFWFPSSTNFFQKNRTNMGKSSVWDIN